MLPVKLSGDETIGFSMVLTGLSSFVDYELGRRPAFRARSASMARARVMNGRRGCGDGRRLRASIWPMTSSSAVTETPLARAYWCHDSYASGDRSTPRRLRPPLAMAPCYPGRIDEMRVHNPSTAQQGFGFSTSPVVVS